MIVEFVQINSLDEIDFDTLFNESYSRMENTFLWHHSLATYELRKKFYYDQLQSAINGTWPIKNDTDTFIMIITKVDGAVVEFTAGFRDLDGYISLRWHLTSAAGTTANRNWRYSKEALQARKDFVASIGVVGFKEFTWVGSLHYRTLRMRANTGNFTLEEYLLPADKSPTGHQLVEFTIRFN